MVGGARCPRRAWFVFKVSPAVVRDTLVFGVVRLVVERATLHIVRVSRASIVVDHILVNVAQQVSSAIFSLLEALSFCHLFKLSVLLISYFILRFNFQFRKE